MVWIGKVIILSFDAAALNSKFDFWRQGEVESQLMSEVLDAARQAAECEGKNPNRPHMLNPNKASAIRRIAGTVYEVLWMEEKLKLEEWKRSEIINGAVENGQDPFIQYATLLEEPSKIKFIRGVWIVTIVPGAVVGLAYLLKGNKQTS